MVDPATSRRWFYRALFLVTCGCVLFVQLLPMATIPNRLPGPDALFAVTAAWVYRRPRQVPVILVCAVFFLADILFLRPPGLWTAAAILGTEFLRRQTTSQQETPILLEIVIFSGTFATMVLLSNLILLIFGVGTPGALFLLMHIVVTIAFYPLAIGLCRYGLGVRKPKPGELDTDEAIA